MLPVSGPATNGAARAGLVWTRLCPRAANLLDPGGILLKAAMTKVAFTVIIKGGATTPRSAALRAYPLRTARSEPRLTQPVSHTLEPSQVTIAPIDLGSKSRTCSSDSSRARRTDRRSRRSGSGSFPRVQLSERLARTACRSTAKSSSIRAAKPPGSSSSAARMSSGVALKSPRPRARFSALSNTWRERGVSGGPGWARPWRVRRPGCAQPRREATPGT